MSSTLTMMMSTFIPLRNANPLPFGSRRTTHHVALMLGFLLIADVSNAQMVGPAGKRIDAFMVDEAPILDGVLDDDAWAFSTPVTDFHQVDPVEFAEPSQESEFFVVYTKDALYIAARLHDREPDKIGASVLQQGEFSWGEDTVTVFVDPLNQGRSGYAFDLTPNGIRNQAIYQNVNQANWNWLGIWHGEARLTDDGWIAEIEIPFKTLSFDPSVDTWGINLGRYIGRNSEQIGWSSRNRSLDPSSFGEITGMSGAEKGIGLTLVPSAGVRQSRDFETGTTADATEPAIDIFYKITPSLTASLTVNTDFSGSGADARQINLTRFSVFFPERRVFFLQDTDVFEFGRIGGEDFDDPTTISRVERESGRPFFSRRIGLGPTGETIDINYGGKLTGKMAGWDIGVLGIRQDASSTLDASDLFVARVSKNVLGESSIGLIFTDGDPGANADNRLAGVDFRYLNTDFSQGKILEGALWYQETETAGLDGDNSAFGVSLRMPSAEGVRAGVAYKEIEQNYFPALGFVNRVNVSDLSADIGYTWYPGSGPIRRAFSGIDFQRIETLQGALQSQAVTFRVIEMKNDSGDQTNLHYQLIDEVINVPFEISDGIVIPVGNYSFDQHCASVVSSEYRAVSVHGSYCGGEFYDGDISSPGAEVIWRPSPHFGFAVGYYMSDVDLPNGSFITRLSTLRANVAFTNAWVWENFLQYDNVSYTLGMNSILRWTPRAGRELVFVVNREFADYTRDRSFTSVSGDITLKFGYTFRF